MGHVLLMKYDVYKEVTRFTGDVEGGKNVCTYRKMDRICLRETTQRQQRLENM